MMKRQIPAQRRLFLGIEGGGTRTVAIMADAAGCLVHRVESGPANLRLISDLQLAGHFRSLATEFPAPSSLGVGLAGVRDERDHARIIGAAAKVWPNVPCIVSHDLETALQAAERAAGGAAATRVIVLSGTGSCCYGRTPAGKTAKVGGWGHLLGDKGSGYEIGLRALKAVVYYYDRDAVWSGLGPRLLRVLQLNEPNDLIGWAQKADKKEIAALAEEVFSAWTAKDKIAADILAGAAHSLANDAVACAGRLVRSNAPVEFVFAGSVLLRQPRFFDFTARQIAKLWPKATVLPLKLEGAWGAVEMARKCSERCKAVARRYDEALPDRTVHQASDPSLPSPPPAPAPKFVIPASSRPSPTEQRNPRSIHLDELPVGEAIVLMLEEDSRVPRAVLAERKKIARAIGFVVRALRRGGRLFYVGAGTSGRLGVLDASECPPTFRASPEQVQGIMAGGQRALWTSIEGAEDDAEAGAQAIQFRNVNDRDVVVGIAASGRTPFVWGALVEARRRRARTILICFNPYLILPAPQRPDLVIVPKVGPEVLTGSTRLKAGTATKIILNLFSTLAMVRLGKVVSNLMVDLKPSNEKLRDRAVRILMDLAGTDYPTARHALIQAKWVVKEAWQKLRSRSQQ